MYCDTSMHHSIVPSLLSGDFSNHQNQVTKRFYAVAASNKKLAWILFNNLISMYPYMVYVEANYIFYIIAT